MLLLALEEDLGGTSKFHYVRVRKWSGEVCVLNHPSSVGDLIIKSALH